MSAGKIPDHKFADSRAARMLASALADASERGISQRSLGKQLNYKQAVVLSHMAHGRVPIPLERAPEIARAVGLAPGEFLLAALEQRSEEAPQLLRCSDEADRANGGFARELALIAGKPLDELGSEHRAVLREVVADPAPTRRWLSLAELPLMLNVRARRPEIHDRGLDERDTVNLMKALSEGRD